VDQPLTVSRDGHIAVLTIDRPEKRNAMTAAMWAALPGVLAPLAGDPAVRALVVTGAGPGFCAGADISDLLGGADPDDPMAEVRRVILAAQAALREFPKPTIAMIRGHCIGGGVEIAASCDLRFADPTGVFGVTPAKVGIVYPPASTKSLIDLVGPSMTKYLLLSGESIDAPTALRTGLVDRLVAPDELEPEVRRFADVLASRSAGHSPPAATARPRWPGGTGRRSPAASSPKGLPRSPNGGPRASVGKAEQRIRFRAARGTGTTGLRRSSRRVGTDAAPGPLTSGRKRLSHPSADGTVAVRHVWRNGHGVAPHPTTNHAEEDR
jgi:enoyl-CoA hydratase/carnithine racemase